MITLHRPRNWILLLVLAVAAVVALTGLTQTNAQTATPEPSPKLTYSKIAGPAVPVGGLVTFTVSVVNSGNADSNAQAMQDTLPAGIDWQIATDTFGCSLGPSAIVGRTLLSCGPVIVEQRHINKTQDDFENGVASVTVVGIANVCGPLFNVALFNGFNPVAATADVLCPTPVPTATPTQTPVPSTPTPTATQPPPTATPTQFVPTATPTQRIAPLPPNTGNSDGGKPGTDVAYGLLVVGALLVLVSVTAYLSVKVNRP